MAEFFVVKMTRNGIELFYQAYGDGFRWVKDCGEAIWFTNPQDAERFAEERFTKFKDWEVAPVPPSFVTV